MCPADGSIISGLERWCRKFAAHPRAEEQEATDFGIDSVSARAAMRLLGDLEPTLEP